jgi:flavodoxin
MRMKGIVAFDSVFGNTKHVAEAIAEELKENGYEIEFIDLGRKVPWKVEADLVFIGSPTRDSRMTSRAKKFVRRLRKQHWASRPVIVFDTVIRLPENERQRERMAKWTVNGAAPRMKALAEKRGLKVYPEVLRAEVTGLKGPLAPGSLDRVREFTRSALDLISKGQA